MRPGRVRTHTTHLHGRTLLVRSETLNILVFLKLLNDQAQLFHFLLRQTLYLLHQLIYLSLILLIILIFLSVRVRLGTLASIGL